LRTLRLVLAFLISLASNGCTQVLGDFQVEPPGDDAATRGAGPGSDASPVSATQDARALVADGAYRAADATPSGGGDSTIAGGSGAEAGLDATPASIDATQFVASEGGDATIAADASTLDAGTPDAHSGSVQAADTIAFTQSPSTGTAGTALSAIVVSVLAPGGAVDAKFTGTIKLGFSAYPSAAPAVLAGVLTATASSGIATFNGIAISQAGTYFFTATSGTLSASSPAVTISPAVGSFQPADGAIVGGDVRAIAVSPTDPNVAYAGTNGGGIYMTTTGTTSPSWTFIGLPGEHVQSLVIDPTNPRVIYVAADGVYRSSDAGATWTNMTATMTGIYVDALAIDPVTTTTLYFGCATGAYKTTDAGQTWVPILANVDASSSMNVTAIGVAPTSPNVIYAGIYGGPIQESKDGGKMWATLPGVFGPDPGAALWYRKIVVDPVDPTIPYVGFENGAAGQGGIWKFTGGVWSLLPGLRTTGMSEAIALNPPGRTSYAVLYGDGLYTSSDGGATWADVGDTTFSTLPIALAVAPSNSAVAYAAAYFPLDGHMMHATTNGGAAWTDASAGLHAYDANSVAVAPTNPSIVYLGGGYNGLHRSTDGATTWGTLETQPSGGGDFYVGVSSKDANLVYAGTNGGGFYKFSDASSTSPGVSVEPGVRTMALAVAASDDQSVYAAAYPGVNGAAYVTANGGTTWANPTLDTFGYGVAIDPSNASVAYIGLSTGAYKTTDHGATWKPMTGIRSFNCMAIDPTNTQNLYAGNETLMHSTDGGTTWVGQTAGLPPRTNPSAMAIDPKTPTTVYAAFETQGVWRTTNGGTTWAQLGLAGWTPKAIAIDPSTPTTIYIGVAAGGLYKTTTGGI